MSKHNNLFKIELPDGWEDNTVHTFRGPDDSGVEHMVTLVVDPDAGDVTLEEYARDRIDTITAVSYTHLTLPTN